MKYIKTSNWIDKISIYQACMDVEIAVRTSYQSLLATLETALFAIFFVLIRLEGSESTQPILLLNYLGILPAIGISLCIIFWFVCEFRANNFDYWRKRIITEAKGTDLKNDFKKGRYGPPEDWCRLLKETSRCSKPARFFNKWVFAHWFERILIPLMIAAWVIILVVV